jgi:hypothetical protein
MMKNIYSDITLTQIRSALERGDDETVAGFRTTKEWAERFSLSIADMRSLLAKVKAAGLLATRIDYRMSIDDKRRLVPVYAFILPEVVSPGA